MILGHGLAGACLALRAHKEGKSVFLLDRQDRNGSSWLAAGLVNPITGRRMSKTWNHDELFPEVYRFYQEAYQTFYPGQSGTFLPARNIFRAVHTIEEQNFFSGKSASPGYSDLLEMDIPKDQFPPLFQNQLSWCRVPGGRLDPRAFLQASESFWHQKSAFLKTEIQPDDLRKTEDGNWFFNNEIEAKTVVSCLGIDCPWLGSEILNDKGQLYVVKGLPEWGNSVLKTEKFLIPLENGEVLCGSTYEKGQRDWNTTSEGWAEISRDLLPERKEKLKIVDAWAGVRPTTKNRQPIVRKVESGLWVINGLGTKGVSVAPWTAKHLLELLRSEGAH